MQRTTYEVVATSSDPFVAPKTSVDANERKDKLQAEIETLQAELADKDPRDSAGRRVPHEEYNAWRTSRIRMLNSKQQELRCVKRWLSQKNGGHKQSEWALLARTHRLLEGLELPPDKQAEVEGLLDDIEFAVPGAFLEGGLARTG